MNKIIFQIISCLNYSQLQGSNFIRLQSTVILTIQDFVYFQ